MNETIGNVVPFPARPRARVTLREPCFEVGELTSSLAEGLADCEVGRALAHFSAPCETCWDTLAKLSGEIEIDLDSAVRFAAEHRPAAVPVGLALLHWLAPATKIAEMSPIVRSLLGRARSEPLAFGRLVLEVGRHLAMVYPASGLYRMQALRKLLRGRHFDRHDPIEVEELRLLAQGYLADEYRVADRPREAYARLGHAQRAEDYRDPEIGATLLELTADLERSLGGFFWSRKCLQRALDLLVSTDIPGRRAETWLRMALLSQRMGDPATAVDQLHRALGEIPEGTDTRLHLEILHHLAATEVRRKNFDEARRFLVQADPHYEALGSRQMRAERSWLSGVLDLIDANYKCAEIHLQHALREHQALGRYLQVVQILVCLLRLYEAPDRDRDRKTILTLLESTISKPEVRMHTLETLCQLLVPPGLDEPIVDVERLFAQGATIN